ncbi:MAG: ATP-dependent RecD-like DNA helicase [Verrucomicrobia bacterium]|nr:ATP-dependent RecD-like DNA helicase [Verrucomicrobiota bacterium]
MEDQICGSIEKILFSNEENGFAVAELSLKTADAPVVVVGALGNVKAGETISCKGVWKHHASYGKQFEVASFETSLPKDLLGIQRYLESKSVKGIGKVYAKKIVAHFGLETLRVIDDEPMRLLEIEGIGEKKVEKIISHREEHNSVRDVMVFLRGHNIGSGLAKKIFRRFGEATIKTLKENPFVLSQEIFGVGFKTADKIASELGIPHSAPARIEAGAEYLLSLFAEQGHTCYPEDGYLTQAEELLQVDRSLIHNAIVALEGKKRIIREKLPTENEAILHLWTSTLFFSEIGIAKRLSLLIQAPPSLRTIKTDKALDWVQETLSIRLAPEQMTALKRSLEEKVHIITGGPGTGKSTVTKAILTVHAKLTEKIILCAPTGRAAKRLGDICRRKAFTIHSILEYDFTNGGFKRNQDNPLECELLIIDESSMIDTYLMHSLLKAIPPSARVIFIGDIDQLPSIGPGNVLKDLIESQKIPVTRLFQIFRQAKGSQITIAAHDINRGIFPLLKSPPEESDLLFYQLEEPEEIIHNIVDLVKNKLPAQFSWDPYRDIQVLSPMRKGVIGIENLNVVLQKHLNKEEFGVARMGRHFRLGDKVMQTRNNYKKMVFNGDIGRIEEVDLDEETLAVSFEHHEVVYEFSELDELTLAYAVSVHKYQGSEAPAILLPVHTSHFKLLQRNLLYTGITRGKKLVILLGTKQALALAIQNNEVLKRYTGLSYFTHRNLLTKES